MARKSLILYQSMTGNTEKVALRFKEVFEKMGWSCDIFKVEPDPNVKIPCHDNPNILNPPFDLKEYDFLCAGSPVVAGQPLKEILNTMFNNPTSAHCHGPAVSEEEEARRRANPIIVPGPQKGVVFVTYGGVHMGPTEPLPALASLEHEMIHLKVQCVGRFACPGKMAGHSMPTAYHRTLGQRPNERDLLKAEIFLEEILEDLR